MKSILFAAMFAGLPFVASAAAPLVGFYQTIDDATNKPKSIVSLYEYTDGDDTELAARIIALYDESGNISETMLAPVRTAPKVDGNPKMAGLDVVWGMEYEEDDDRYEDGKIMDPKNGKIYSSLIWQEDADKINVRGKIGPFGRTQVWNVLQKSELPKELQNIDTKNWKPKTRD